MARPKRDIVGYVRFPLSEEELKKLDMACKKDERCRSDFARIYVLRAIDAVLGLDVNKKAVDFISEMRDAFMQLNASDESNDKKK
jgi:hypothetical protein